MIKVRKSVFHDFLRIDIRDEQAMFTEDGSLAMYAKEVLLHYETFTAEADGQILLIGSVVQRQEDLYEAFAIVSRNCGKHLIAITRYINRLMPLYDKVKVKAHILTSDKSGHRFAKLVGFRPLYELPTFYKGHNFVLYVRP
jgi:hypothetical protein